MEDNTVQVKAQRGSRGTALFILNFGARWSWTVIATPRPLYPWKRALVPIVQEAGWAPGPVRKYVEKIKSLATTGVQIPYRPARTESLYRLRHPGLERKTIETKPIIQNNTYFPYQII